MPASANLHSLYNDEDDLSEWLSGESWDTGSALLGGKARAIATVWPAGGASYPASLSHVVGGRWEAPQGTSPTPVLLTPQQGQRKCHSMGVSAPSISSRTFQHCASTSNEAPSLPWSPQTSPAPPACYVFSQHVAFVSRSTLSSVSSRTLHIVAGVRPSLLYLISLASKLTQQKNTLAGKKPSESTGEVRAKGAWKMWHSAQSCQRGS